MVISINGDGGGVAVLWIAGGRANSLAGRLDEARDVALHGVALEGHQKNDLGRIRFVIARHSHLARTDVGQRREAGLERIRCGHIGFPRADFASLDGGTTLLHGTPVATERAIRLVLRRRGSIELQLEGAQRSRAQCCCKRVVVIIPVVVVVLALAPSRRRAPGQVDSDLLHFPEVRMRDVSRCTASTRAAISVHGDPLHLVHRIRIGGDGLLLKRRIVCGEAHLLHLINVSGHRDDRLLLADNCTCLRLDDLDLVDARHRRAHRLALVHHLDGGTNVLLLVQDRRIGDDGLHLAHKRQLNLLAGAAEEVALRIPLHGVLGEGKTAVVRRILPLVLQRGGREHGGTKVDRGPRELVSGRGRQREGSVRLRRGNRAGTQAVKGRDANEVLRSGLKGSLLHSRDDIAAANDVVHSARIRHNAHGCGRVEIGVCVPLDLVLRDRRTAIATVHGKVRAGCLPVELQRHARKHCECRALHWTWDGDGGRKRSWCRRRSGAMAHVIVRGDAHKARNVRGGRRNRDVVEERRCRSANGVNVRIGKRAVNVPLDLVRVDGGTAITQRVSPHNLERGAGQSHEHDGPRGTGHLARGLAERSGDGMGAVAFRSVRTDASKVRGALHQGSSGADDVREARRIDSRAGQASGCDALGDGGDGNASAGPGEAVPVRGHLVDVTEIRNEGHHPVMAIAVRMAADAHLATGCELIERDLHAGSAHIMRQAVRGLRAESSLKRDTERATERLQPLSRCPRGDGRRCAAPVVACRGDQLRLVANVRGELDVPLVAIRRLVDNKAANGGIIAGGVPRSTYRRVGKRAHVERRRRRPPVPRAGFNPELHSSDPNNVCICSFEQAGADVNVRRKRAARN